ncbi:Abi family protein [Bradymonas sediminis]|uniref:Abortive phage resistance protein n=1 Tax=Bradymonas sediminis TaxID=1548548 RepID=A0A2Z4FK72_9DELT|nr:Abi family protein [Bradymonas sediminis]AWV89349.1 abortive phage resistance protein [Bradymonas sediminis]TDP73528.1 abortive infection bacteriophage resistance protein [Bradymonas sediminis]
MKPLKPWRSYEKQLQRLQGRGLLVEDVAAATDYLQRIGYYRLSGYWYPLRVIDASDSEARQRLDEFMPGSRFEDVARLYVFDKKLRLLALDALERIEMAVRVDVAYLLGKYDPCAHELPKYLHGNFAKKKMRNGRTKHELWLSKYERARQRARKQPFIEHHAQEYGGSLPIWVAIEIWDFGLLSHLFAGMQHHDKQIIAENYGAPDGQAFAQWLRSLNFIRNVAAHHSRLWNINVPELSASPPTWPRALRHERPFFYFCIMQQLLKVICPTSSWGQRLQRLLNEEFPKRFDLDGLGTFENWETWSLWQ